MDTLSDIPFPAYDALLAKVGNTPYDENSLDLKKVASAINHLDENGEELSVIYALMIRHFLNEAKDKVRKQNNVILYNGKTFDIGKGLMYTFTQLPPLLQQIIVQYMREITKM